MSGHSSKQVSARLNGLPMTYIKAGHGFNVGQDFSRVMVDTPAELAPAEYAQPGHVIGQIADDPSSKLGFMHALLLRVHRSEHIMAGLITARDILIERA
jgi:hypothetical protein